MKYNLIGDNNILEPIPTIFKNRGIDDYKGFMNLKEDVTLDWRLLDHIEDGVRLLDRHLKNDSLMFIQTDSDADGECSSSILYNYLHKLKPDIKLKWRTHDKKMHGIIPSTIPDDVDLLLIPDSSSSQYEEHKELRDKGIDIIILDHHESEKYSEYANVVVNNQLSKKYKNKQIAAVGIVYKFCQALDEYYDVNYADEYLDLVAIGNISDSMSTREMETRYYIQQGLKKIKNPLIKAIIKKNAYNLNGKVNIKDVSWTIAPTINATTRIGTVEDRENMFKAMTGQPITHSKLKDGEDPIDGMARILTNVRGRQNTMRTKGEKAVNERIAEKGIDKNKMIIVNATDIIDEPALNGVVAIKIAEKYKKPTLIIRQGEEDESIFGGSARAYDAGAIPNLKDFLNETKMFEFCEGHQGAFGLEIQKNSLVPMNDLVNERLKDIDVDVDSYNVDLEIDMKHLTKGLVAGINEYADVWGKDVEEPLLTIKNIKLDKSAVLLQGKSKNVLKFVVNGIEFIRFGSSEEEYKSIVDVREGKNKRISLNLIGTCAENVFRGQKTQQIRIVDFEVEAAEDKLLF